MFCPKCGALLRDGARFCESCGARMDDAGPRQDSSGELYGRAPDGSRPAPGYSRLLDSEPVRLALEKQQRATRIAGIVLVLLPLLGFLIYGAVSDKMELGRALVTGLVVSAVFGLTTLVVTLKKKLSKPFEGTLSDKKHVHHISSSKHRAGRSRNEYFLYITDGDGKRRKKPTTVTVYNYLQVGDRLRYLPQFPQPFEKYDKSGDAEIVCMFCGCLSPIDRDECAACRNPLLK